jgi:Tfp pilus assembly protein PilF
MTSPLPVTDLRRYAAWAIALLAVAASISGIRNGFALDDVHIIVQNVRVQSIGNAFNVFAESYWPPDKGGALYRPLTSVAFILQWWIGGGSPFPFHLVSIVLYACVSVAVFRLASPFVDWPVAWIAAALFAVHPLHVEVVANVVGQAELWAALLAIPAATHHIKARRRGDLSRRDVVLVSVLFGGALLFKEHVVVLPVLLVAAEFLVVGGNDTGRARIAKIAPVILVMSLVAAVFVMVRASVLGSVEGAGVSPIFVGYDYETRLFTMLRVMMEWLRLFFWPARLATDYAPLIELSSSFRADMLAGVISLLGLTAVAVYLRRSRPQATFALAWAGITLLIPSNLVVVTGFVLAERALFLASAGMMIAVAVALEAVARQSATDGRVRQLVGAGVAALLVLGIARSSVRNQAWRDNKSLIEQNVVDLPRSWHAHMMMAQLHSDRGRRSDALRETDVAVRLGEKSDFRLLAFAADMFQMHGRCDRAVDYYRRSLAIKPNQPQVRTNAAICDAKVGRVADAN